MLNRHNRLLVTFHVVSDALLAVTAFIIAYALRFHSGIIPLLIPITKGVPPLRQYIEDLPFIAILVPLGFQLQGLYRMRRGGSRVDDFFAVFVGSILAVLFGIVATLYVTVYWASPVAKASGQFEVSQPVWGIFLILNVALTFSSRELVREALERRWRAGIGLKRILIAGSGDLGRLVADSIANWGIRLSASSTTRPPAIISGTAACRCLARSRKPQRSRRAKRSTICTSRCRRSSTCRC
jgi:FlaA1/EpsC-like NDP-sugar epimerase